MTLVAVTIFSSGALMGILGPLLVLTAAATAAWAFGRTSVTKAQAEAINTWHENYAAQAEKTTRLEGALAEQRHLKHEALAALAAAQMKTDQTIVLEELAAMRRDFAAREKVGTAILDTLARQREEFIATLVASQEAGLSSLTLELKHMEGRIVEAIGAQTEALTAITAELTNGRQH